MASYNSTQRSSPSIKEEFETLECGCGGGKTAELSVSKNSKSCGHLFYKCFSCTFYVWWTADKQLLRMRATKAREAAEEYLKEIRGYQSQARMNDIEVSSRRGDSFSIPERQIQEMGEDMKQLIDNIGRLKEEFMKFREKQEEEIRELKMFKETTYYWGKCIIFFAVIAFVLYVKWN